MLITTGGKPTVKASIFGRIRRNLSALHRTAIASEDTHHIAVGSMTFVCANEQRLDQ